MQINYILDKIIDYAIFSLAHTIDLDICNNQNEVKFINATENETLELNNNQQSSILEGLCLVSKIKHYSCNKITYTLNYEEYNKINGIRAFIKISKEPSIKELTSHINSINNTINTRNLNLSKQGTISFIISPNYTCASTILYSLLKTLNNLNSNIYLFDRSPLNYIDGIHQVLFNKYCNNNKFEAIWTSRPNIIALNNPNIKTIKQAISLCNRGSSITLSISSKNITSAISKLINSKICPKNLSYLLNLILFQSSPKDDIKILSVNNVTRQTLRHPRLSNKLLIKAINQNLCHPHG